MAIDAYLKAQDLAKRQDKFFKGMRKYMFIYNSICHILMAALFMVQYRKEMMRVFNESVGWDAEFGRFAFVAGHYILSTAQYSFATQSGDEDNFRITILGTAGHLLLLIYMAWKRMYIEQKWAQTIFIGGQLGMIYFYNNHMNKEDVIYDTGTVKIRKKHLFIVIFVSLLAYYFGVAVRHEEMAKYGYGAVASVYFVLILYFLTFK